MNSTFAEAAGESPRSTAVPARKPLRDALLTLVRRELWEHRYLWLAPLCVAALLLLVAILGQVHFDLDDVPQFANSQQRVALFTIVQWAISALYYLFALFIVSYYALDCLYAERKDRSILFWKSLPVSDGLTVGAKLLTALVVVPAGIFVLSLLASLVFFAILTARAALGSLPTVLTWDTLEWLRTAIAMLLIQILAALWYAPIVAYLMVVSAWAKRSPFLWSSLPWVVAPILEHIAFGTRYLWHFMLYRSNGIWQTLAFGRSHIFSHHGHSIRPVGTLLEDLNFRGAFTDVDLWLGLAVTAALVYAAVRIRRFRDDT
jgi:ABC-2 type transport system permease protein